MKEQIHFDREAARALLFDRLEREQEAIDLRRRVVEVNGNPNDPRLRQLSERPGTVIHFHATDRVVVR